jgi:murein DD-endopeptidase MepM/ murein hydrolase activator NlpD
VARHRSPQGRRTHLGLPLPPLAAAAGAGGGALASPSGASLAPRVIATVLAGGALAAAGQAALSHTMPIASEGANVLKLGVQELLGTSTSSPVAPLALVPAVGPVVAPPRPVDVGSLVKAAERHHRAARTATAPDRSAPVEAPTDAPTDATVDAPTPEPQALPSQADVAADAVQMVTGRVTSGFGSRWGRAHKGLDIAAPIGTPIHVPMAGEVIASGPASGFGLWVRIRHDDGTVTTYGHVNRALVRVGEQVTAGQEIAEVGNRGHSTGPHLHVEVQTPGGVTVNPRPWLDGHGIGY